MDAEYDIVEDPFDDFETFVPGGDGEFDHDLEERIISEDVAWTGKIFDVSTLDVVLPSDKHSRRDVVRHPGASAVVALTDSGKVVLVRQYRTALDHVTVELPAGKLDGPEDPLLCAKRELKEETGFVAERWTYMTTIATSAGFSDELIHIYLANNLKLEGANPDEDEFVNVDFVSLDECVRAVMTGRIEDAKTIVGILMVDSIFNKIAGMNEESTQEEA
jgi:ADP-ribose pyrophosphatase